jgi:Cu+-exporting ATPase
MSKADCFHCGEAVMTAVHADGKVFCCHGCSQVYEIIHSEGLQHYYDIDSRIGQKVGEDESLAMEALKRKDVYTRYVSYEDDERRMLSWACPQIHCRACVWLLEKLPEMLPFVVHSKVDIIRQTFECELRKDHGEDEGDASVHDLAQYLVRLGYAPDLSRRPHREKEIRDDSRSDWLKVGVAGFCFGNVMLFSFPEYLAHEDMGEGFERLFRILAGLLSLPSLLYCSRDILKKGLGSLRWKTLGVDVPIAIGILTLFLWSAWELVVLDRSGYFDSLTGLIFFLLAGRAFQHRSFRHLVFEKDEHRFFPLTLQRFLLKKEKEYQSENNSENNNEHADAEYADADVIDEDQVFIETISLSELKKGDEYQISNGAMIPTESLLLSGEGLLDYRLVTGESDLKKRAVDEQIYAGGIQRGGRLRLRALASVEEGSLARMWSGTGEERSSVESLLDRIGKVFTVVVLLLAMVTFLSWAPDGLGKAMEVTCAVLIIACPCALALSAPLTFGMALRELAHFGCYVKEALFIEVLSKVSLVALDKTGTLTCVEETSGQWLGVTPEHEHKFEGLSPVEGLSKERVQGLAVALASHSNHPVSVALASTELSPQVLNSVQTMEVCDFVEEVGKGISGRMDGHFIRIGSPQWFGVEEERGTFVEVDGQICERFEERLRVREGVEMWLKAWPSDLKRRLLSGDDDKDEQRMLRYFKPDEMFFGQSSEQKALRVQGWRGQGEVVAMMGDGVNDGEAMLAADVGIAIPVGSGRFSPSSDIILAEDRVSNLTQMLSFAKGAVKIVVICVAVSLLYNVLGLSFAVTGSLSPLVSAILMPVSSLTVMMLSIFGTQILAKRTMGSKES